MCVCVCVSHIHALNLSHIVHAHYKLACVCLLSYAGELSTALEVFSKAWGYAKTAMTADDPLHLLLCEQYVLALMESGDERGAEAVVDEGVRRGLPRDNNSTTEE